MCFIGQLTGDEIDDIQLLTHQDVCFYVLGWKLNFTKACQGQDRPESTCNVANSE